MNECWVLSSAFSASIEMIMRSLFFLLFPFISLVVIGLFIFLFPYNSVLEDWMNLEIFCRLSNMLAFNFIIFFYDFFYFWYQMLLFHFVYLCSLFFLIILVKGLLILCILSKHQFLVLLIYYFVCFFLFFCLFYSFPDTYDFLSSDDFGRCYSSFQISLDRSLSFSVDIFSCFLG